MVYVKFFNVEVRVVKKEIRDDYNTILSYDFYNFQFSKFEKLFFKIIYVDILEDIKLPLWLIIYIF